MYRLRIDPITGPIIETTHAVYEDALGELREYVTKQWLKELPDKTPPTDEMTMIDAYFNQAGEYFNIEAEEPAAVAVADMALHVTQWRELGDDEDCLDVRLAPKDADVITEIAAENQVHRTEEDEEEKPGDMQVINTETIHDGQVFERDGKQYRIRIEEVTL